MRTYVLTISRCDRLRIRLACSNTTKKAASFIASLLFWSILLVSMNASLRADDADERASDEDFTNLASVPPAPEEELSTDSDDLLQRIERLERENQELKDAWASEKSNSGSNAFLSSISDRLNKLETKTADKKPLIKLGGFFQLDNAFFTQDSPSHATYGDIQDGTGFRRARLQAYGSVTDHTNYIIEMDFATAGRPSFMDVWGEQTDIPWLGSIRIGQFRQPTTMDGLTSVRHLEFLERGNAFQALDPFRRVGIMAYNSTENKRATWAGSIYRTGASFFNPSTGANTDVTLGDTRYATFLGDNGGWSTALRVTALPIFDECDPGCHLLHVGAGYNYSRIGGNGLTPSGANGGQYIARTIPGVFIGDPELPGVTSSSTPFVSNTGNINATDFHFFHVELAGQNGPAHFQTEVMATELGTNNFGWQPLFGTYAQAGYFLTGERCGYNRVVGVMDYVTTPLNPKLGAWEVAYRFDFTNLPNVGQVPVAAPGNAGTAGGNPNPGQLYMNTLALNWWWNQYTRVQFNYINAFNNSDFAVYGSSHTHVFATRFQVEF